MGGDRGVGRGVCRWEETGVWVGGVQVGGDRGVGRGCRWEETGVWVGVCAGGRRQ